MTPTIAVVGGGAMGGTWAGRLAAAGADVAVVDVSNVLVEAYQAGGITVVTAADSESHGNVAATTDIATIGPRDVIFIFVKGPHTRAACARLDEAAGPGATVVSLQNGWGNADVISEAVDPARIVVGVTFESATIREAGRIDNLGHGPTHLGPYRSEAGLEDAERVAELMRGAGFECQVTTTVRTEVWRKLIHNAACLAVAGLTDLRTNELVDPGDVADLIDAIATEAVDVAVAEGHAIETSERIEAIHRVLGASGAGIASMLADVHARRPTEIDTINGAIVRAAQRHAMDVPLNRAMVALVHGLERSWQLRG